MDLGPLGQEELRIIGQVALAMGLGAALGFERELSDKPAGLRTHMLVAGAAALLVALGDVVVARFGSSVAGATVRADPTRLIEAVVTGVSFLGAGTIIRGGRQREIEGLTTAASLLFAAAVGVCVAVSALAVAIAVTALVLLTLSGVGRLSRRIRASIPSGEREAPGAGADAARGEAP